MKRFLAYFKYVLVHKWYVLLACFRLGIPWRGLVHDLSKLSHTEFWPYACQFFNADGTRRNVRNPDGSYDPAEQAIEFQGAWIHHQRNKHHWQAWVSIGDGGNLTPVPMPDVYWIEMVADWMGAGMAISGKKDPAPWWEANKHKMILDNDTNVRIVSLIYSKAVQGWEP